MKKRFVKALALVMAAATMLTACGGGAANSGAQTGGDNAAAGTESTDAPKEMVDITVMVYDRGHEYKAPNTFMNRFAALSTTTETNRDVISTAFPSLAAEKTSC